MEKENQQEHAEQTIFDKAKPTIIEYPTQCSTCEIHKTDLGLLKDLENTIEQNFPDWSIDKKSALVIAWFERIWHKELARDEKEWKQNMANQIQKSKEKNIKEINK